MITILMTVYRVAPAFLRQAIYSIRRQTWREFEFLILIDGAPEQDLNQDGVVHGNETALELQRHAAEDARIRLHWEPHRGLTSTLNRGLDLARGEWIARQDADDWSAPDRLERQIAALRPTRDHILCGSNAWLHQKDGNPLWRTHLPENPLEIRQAFWKGNPFVHGSTLFRAHAARRIGGYREAFACSQDYDFFWRLAEEGVALNLPEPLYHYRFHSAAVSARRSWDQSRVHLAARRLAQARKLRQAEEIEQALREATQTLRPGKAWMPTREMAAVALKQADHRLLAGDYEGAFRDYLRLTLRHPAQALAWGKLARWALFTLFPPLRQLCFR